MADFVSKLVRAKQVWEMLGISKTTLHRWVDEGKFPPPFSIGDNTRVWRLSVVEAFITQKEQESELASA